MRQQKVFCFYLFFNCFSSVLAHHNSFIRSRIIPGLIQCRTRDSIVFAPESYRNSTVTSVAQHSICRLKSVYLFHISLQSPWSIIVDITIFIIIHSTPVNDAYPTMEQHKHSLSYSLTRWRRGPKRWRRQTIVVLSSSSSISRSIARDPYY